MSVFIFNKFYSFAKETYNFVPFFLGSITRKNHDALIPFLIFSFS
jgi:hypothetical protein